MHVLLVIDMQKDFIDGALGTPEAVAIVPRVVEKMRQFDGRILCTRDTHGPDYPDSLEGRHLPVPHCIRGTDGWQLHPEVAAACTEPPIDKPTFGSTALGQLLQDYHRDLLAQGREGVTAVTLVGLCTDICVISNALLLKAFLPEVPIAVDSRCCAGVTPESHENALNAMQCCQIEIL
ncbi:cysteine hydrolase family protein [Candidatus Avoscillospira sp. LCP25S3_F1]|uniref:cysteine hydrolase family protein n=1 Tax=Candidatus Avoscillospira sp. LCP25S3_F1 TaxID=3438825 RepID=UPI003F8DC3F5